MSVPERNTGSLNSGRLTAGTVAVSSRMTKAASATTATKASTAMSGESNQSLRLPSSSTYCSDARPTDEQGDARPVHVLALLGGGGAVRCADVLRLVHEARAP